MKKLAGAVFCVFFCFSSSSWGQENRTPQARLVRSPFAGGDVLHAIQEAALDLKEYASGVDNTIAIRVCSREPMPVALSIAAANPFIMLEYLEHYGFQRERVLLLRAEDCLSDNPAVAVTEFWAIPRGAAPPPSVESITSNQARLEVIRTEDRIESVEDYFVALRQLIVRLRAGPKATGVIVGIYHEQPSSALLESLQQAQRLLRQSGLSPTRFYVRAIASSRVRQHSEPEPRYPSIFIVEIERRGQCDT